MHSQILVDRRESNLYRGAGYSGVLQFRAAFAENMMQQRSCLPRYIIRLWFVGRMQFTARSTFRVHRYMKNEFQRVRDCAEGEHVYPLQVTLLLLIYILFSIPISTKCMSKKHLNDIEWRRRRRGPSRQSSSAPLHWSNRLCS